VVCHPVLSHHVITCWANSPPVGPCLQVNTRALQRFAGTHGGCVCSCSSAGAAAAHARLHQAHPGTQAACCCRWGLQAWLWGVGALYVAVQVVGACMQVYFVRGGGYLWSGGSLASSSTVSALQYTRAVCGTQSQQVLSAGAAAGCNPLQGRVLLPVKVHAAAASCIVFSALPATWCIQNRM
jgi:hypothetical protein